MTELGVKGGQGQRTLPFIPQQAHAAHWKFANGLHTLLVEPGTAQRMREASERALPRETGGLLYGRQQADDDGRYTVISGFAEARRGSGKRASFEVSPEDLAKLRADSGHPDTAEMGWWHSHPRPNGYSPTDFATQRMLQREEGVGLLVFARGTAWATAYIGPDAVPLGLPHQLAPADTPPAERRKRRLPAVVRWSRRLS